METFDGVKVIIENVLGEPKRDYAGSGGWYEYNCPHCADENGSPDGKYNLAVNPSKLWGHCWRCGYSGRISKILRQYGSHDDITDYRNEIRSIKGREQYSFDDDLKIDEELQDVGELELPEGFKTISSASGITPAIGYLRSRGITDEIIERYSIGYIGNEFNKDRMMKNRIILQSHDIYGNLNFWVGRDYTGKSKIKYKNSPVEKKDIIFDEDKVNWYEPITIVEGPFDHIVVPNSIPLLGKTIGPDYSVAKALIEKSRSTINIFLDDDAYASAIKAYKFLNSTPLNGRIRIVKCPEGTDAADIFKDYGYKGILNVLRTARKLGEFELLNI